MKQRDFTSAKAKEALLHDMKDEFKLLEQHQPQKELVESLIDGTAQMCKDVAKKEGDIAIRLHLLRAVIENITLRESIVKYKVRKGCSDENVAPQRFRDYQLFNVYDGYVKLVPREPVSAEDFDWQTIEGDFTDFLMKGLEV